MKPYSKVAYPVAVLFLLACALIAGVPDTPPGRLGLQVKMEKGALMVTAVDPGSPANRAGIRKDDMIIAIDGFETRGKTLEEAMAHLRGPAGTSVTLAISRPGSSDLLTITAVRQELSQSEQYFEEAFTLFQQKKFSQAFPPMKKAAEMGLTNAQTYLGWMYQNGQGVATDYPEARRWYREAAEHGDVYSCDHLGFMNKNGLGADPDYKEAWTWYRKALEGNLPSTQYNVCMMYQDGLGVKQNYDKAFEYCMLAAKQDYADAQAQIGYFYLNGLGVKKDYNECFRWSMKASEKGSMHAPYNLGWLYEYGLGVKQDLEESIRWYRLSEVRGLAVAKEKLASLPSLNLLSSDAQPAELQSGDPVRLNVLFEINGLGPGQTTSVRIRRDLLLNGSALLHAPLEETTILGTGRHTNTFEFRTPKFARPGTYICRVTVSGLGGESATKTVFVIGQN